MLYILGYTQPHFHIFFSHETFLSAALIPLSQLGLLLLNVLLSKWKWKPLSHVQLFETPWT